METHEIGLVEECLFRAKFFNCGLAEKNGSKNGLASMALLHCEAVCSAIRRCEPYYL